MSRRRRWAEIPPLSPLFKEFITPWIWPKSSPPLFCIDSVSDQLRFQNPRNCYKVLRSCTISPTKTPLLSLLIHNDVPAVLFKHLFCPSCLVHWILSTCNGNSAWAGACQNPDELSSNNSSFLVHVGIEKMSKCQFQGVLLPRISAFCLQLVIVFLLCRALLLLHDYCVLSVIKQRIPKWYNAMKLYLAAE